MSAIIKRLGPCGLDDSGIAASSLDEAAWHEPSHGVYTVGRTYPGARVLLLDAHLDRLEASASASAIALRYERRRLRAALRDMLLEADFGAARFRISVAADSPETLTVSLEPFKPPPPVLLAQGARCQTARATRQNPAVKSSAWMRQRRSLESDGIYETFLVDDSGALLEGLTSNFYAILEGQLRTAHRGVLAGISRRIVYATHGGVIPLRKEAAHTDDIPRFSEAFLSSSSRGIVPVVELDGKAIGDGRVGAVTRALRQAYEAWVARHLEAL